jgi:hypothetical protein
MAPTVAQADDVSIEIVQASKKSEHRQVLASFDTERASRGKLPVTV